MTDVLGFDRFDQHCEWRCSGHIDGDVDEMSEFVLERHGDCWLLTTGDQGLVVVGDSTRDLVATDGGLARHPTPHGFAPYLAANLLRQIGVLARSELSSWGTAREPVASEHAGRSAADVSLRHSDDLVTLGVDAETGIWTWLDTAGFTIVVDELTVGTDAAKSFGLLDLVPDVDLSQRVSASETLTLVMEALHAASGLDTQTLYEDEETGEFRVVLVGSDGQPQGLVSRTHAPTRLVPAVFGGLQQRWDSDDWAYHIDTASDDHEWSGRIVKTLNSLS